MRNRAALRVAEQAAQRHLAEQFAGMPVTPITDPLEALSRLAGEQVTWSDLLRKHLADLAEWRYEANAGEQLNAMVALFERAQERATTTLTAIARLDIDQRIIAMRSRIDHAQAELLLAAMREASIEAGLSHADQVRLRDALLPRLVEAEETGVVSPAKVPAGPAHADTRALSVGAAIGGSGE